MTRKTIEAAIRIANRGTTSQIVAMEDAHGLALSTIIDEGWAWAEDRGDVRLAARCERAFNKLTGQ